MAHPRSTARGSGGRPDSQAARLKPPHRSAATARRSRQEWLGSRRSAPTAVTALPARRHPAPAPRCAGESDAAPARCRHRAGVGSVAVPWWSGGGGRQSPAGRDASSRCSPSAGPSGGRERVGMTPEREHAGAAASGPRALTGLRARGPGYHRTTRRGALSGLAYGAPALVGARALAGCASRRSATLPLSAPAVLRIPGA